MNAAVRLYADAANAKTKLENGFDLTDYDERTLFAKDYCRQAAGHRCQPEYHRDARCGMGAVRQVLQARRGEHQEGELVDEFGFGLKL